MQTHCNQCEKVITITGDGSCAFVTEREGGPGYFCSEACKQAWLKHPQRQLRGVVVGVARSEIPFVGLTAYQEIIKQRFR
jgi:YHS domain-containing protein